MRSLCVMCALVLSATAAMADMLPPGTYVQHDEGGEHAAASSVGGYVVRFDDQLFLWNGSSYTNGLCVLEFIEIVEGEEYGWILVCPDSIDTGVVTSAGQEETLAAVRERCAAGRPPRHASRPRRQP